MARVHSILDSSAAGDLGPEHMVECQSTDGRIVAGSSTNDERLFPDKGNYQASWNDAFMVQTDVADLMGNFPVMKRLVKPQPMRPHQCYIETQADIQDLPTGKVRLELKWGSLSPAWKSAFEEPIKDALDVYFKYDAVAPVMVEENIDHGNILPSRFVLVNKSEPRNVSPLDEQLEDARLKARWVVSGHRDKEAGMWETEAPTASLVAHNLLCFFAAQFGWTMFFGDITDAFLQGENLHPDRKVLVSLPRGYPDFVQQFLASKLPSGARHDLVRFTKGGFGLAESPRLLQKTLIALGAKEWLLIPGVFSVFLQGEIVAMIACHVDDIRLVGHPEKAKPVWEAIKSEFTFGEWRNVAEQWAKFCGRYERQLPDGTIEVQMDEYCEKLQFPPKRTKRSDLERDGTELTMTERKWVGHVCGQLSWLARQCRGDLLFGVSRAQQLAGVGDPAALEELYVLVERATDVKTMRFMPLGCSPSQWLVVAASDASFGGMPRGRSQGGTVCLIAHPGLLEGRSGAVPISFQSALLKRVVRSSLAAEISQAAEALDQADFLRAVMAEALYVAFDIDQWLTHVAHWRLVTVLDSRTGV